MLLDIPLFSAFLKGMKSMKINLHNQTKEDIKAIRALLKLIFNPIKESKNMQIIFINQEKIHEMNKTYRNIDRPTDVLLMMMSKMIH